MLLSSIRYTRNIKTKIYVILLGEEIPKHIYVIKASL